MHRTARMTHHLHPTATIRRQPRMTQQTHTKDHGEVDTVTAVALSALAVVRTAVTGLD